MTIHSDNTPGLTMGDYEIKEVHNSYGQHYFVVKQQIGTIFGSEVEGEIQAIGKTKEIALQRLAEERKKLHESLWD